MHLLFEAHGVRSELELQPGTWTLGGAEDDGVRFPGLPPRLLELDLSPDRAWVACTRELPVGRAVLAPGVRRWLLPGERIRLSREARLWLEPPSETAGTLALARSLLEGGGAPLCSPAPALACVVGVDAGTVYLLAGSVTEVGRGTACTVRLGDAAVSRRHLQLVLGRRGHRVQDVGGRNRARWNGRWLRSGQLLADGDLLEVGRSLLHYRRGSPEAKQAAAPAPVSASGTGPPAPPGAPSGDGAG
jgi:type III secretion system (T3SS) inner membrane Yop/YscD-like protein